MSCDVLDHVKYLRDVSHFRELAGAIASDADQHEATVQANVLNLVEKGTGLSDLLNYVLDECDSWWPSTLKESVEVLTEDLLQKREAINNIRVEYPDPIASKISVHVPLGFFGPDSVVNAKLLTSGKSITHMVKRPSMHKSDSNHSLEKRYEDDNQAKRAAFDLYHALKKPGSPSPSHPLIKVRQSADSVRVTTTLTPNEDKEEEPEHTFRPRHRRRSTIGSTTGNEPTPVTEDIVVRPRKKRQQNNRKTQAFCLDGQVGGSLENILNEGIFPIGNTIEIDTNWPLVPEPACTPFPEVSTTLPCLVSSIINPGHFFVYKAASAPALKKLMQSMTTHYQVEPYQGLGHPAVDSLVAVNASDIWYRGRVLQSLSIDEVEVFLIDFGACHRVPLTALRPMHEEFNVFPQQSLECFMKDIEEPPEKYTKQNLNFFVDTCLSKVFNTQVFEYEDQTMIVELIDDNGNSINALLLETKNAIKKTSDDPYYIQENFDDWFGSLGDMNSQNDDNNANALKRQSMMIKSMRIGHTRLRSMKTVSALVDLGEPGSHDVAKRFGYCIPHRFSAGKQLLFRGARCRTCGKKISFNSRIHKCKECGYACHDVCLTRVPPNCGLPDDDNFVLTAQPIMGITLSELAVTHHRTVPRLVEACIHRIEIDIREVGLYRIPGRTSDIARTEILFQYGQPNLADIDVHTCTSLLKKFFRELPEPLLTHRLYDTFVSAAGIANPQEKKEALCNTVAMLPPVHIATLRTLMKHLLLIITVQENAMTIHNIATILGPSLIRGRRDPSSSGGIVILLDLLRLPASFWD